MKMAMAPGPAELVVYRWCAGRMEQDDCG